MAATNMHSARACTARARRAGCTGMWQVAVLATGHCHTWGTHWEQKQRAHGVKRTAPNSIRSALSVGSHAHVPATPLLVTCRYDGMQKVGPGGVLLEGVSDRISAGRVASEPLSIRHGNQLVRDPAAHFDQYRPSVAKLAVRAGAWGAGAGALLGAGVALGSSFWTKGQCDEGDVAGVVAGAVWGVATGALTGFISVLARSTVAGSAAAGAVGVWGAVEGCTDERVAVQKAAASFASIAGGVCAGSLCARCLSPAAAAVAAPLAALCVSGWVLRGVGGGDAGTGAAASEKGEARASWLRTAVL